MLDNVSQILVPEFRFYDPYKTSLVNFLQQFINIVVSLSSWVDSQFD
jgi:hypothetical protein